MMTQYIVDEVYGMDYASCITMAKKIIKTCKHGNDINLSCMNCISEAIKDFSKTKQQTK